MSRYEDELEEQFIEEPENDLEQPADGRDGTTDHGSSDDPESLDAMDPLRRDTFLLDGDQDGSGVPDDGEGTSGPADGEDVLDEDSEWDGLEDEDDGGDGDDQR
ncbi:hypothetical protein [Citricoccus sp. I39-566]|uniref:hypothetical protein n=1 Tax=Citricoccus sp. I39-566 TaxID=3073268 RepID=UPI00286B05B5|nr:hypothetical protein [Citricoccus sp. I39-566]WMY78415.1 hypothetical protein RE421_00720 [Citricoccus sp. I39-566]